MDKVSVLASGGLDSSVLIAQMAREAQVYPIYVKCGLAWEHIELQGLHAFIDALGNPNVMPLTVLSAPIAAAYGDHWSVSGTSVPAADDPDEAMFIPGRNILLIGFAAIWCSTHGVSRIVIGSLGGNPFPDATPEFFDSFARALGLGLRHELRIEAPWRGLHKDDVIKMFSDLPLELTFTCAAPRDGLHCGRCNKCYERQVAFKTSGIADRTRYAP
ncbi:MAG: 7-cyano-7-deazaguanine synthase [Candidatus Binataceae bacterium]